jgi:hypothetical protein
MTDAEQLATLRAWPGWPWESLDALAVEAAAKGRLCEAIVTADRLNADRVVGSSNVTISPEQVPMSAFSDFGDQSSLWYHHLWLELQRALGRAPLGEWESED